MLSINDLLKVCNSYDITSTSLGPTIYKSGKELGLCLDIKDTNFGYLTRIFPFKNIIEAEDFLKKYNWYLKNYKNTKIELFLDQYDIEKPNIKYKYKERELTFDEMTHIDKYTEEEQELKHVEKEKDIYLENISNLTNYLISIKNKKIQTKEKKNNLKKEENDLKFELLSELTSYYDKEVPPQKKNIDLEIIDYNTNNNLLLQNIENLRDKGIEDIKSYLKNLINTIKEEELEENNFVNDYSNAIYEYNIDILKKQIEFVRKKIASEKNFNVKGTKIHNIDAELKSFLSTPINLENINIFIKNNQDKINIKYNKLDDIKNASLIITGEPVSSKSEKLGKNYLTKIQIINNINDQFNKLDIDSQNCLVLYHSFYKEICNFIIENNYPNIDLIMEKFDFNEYYQNLDYIIHLEHNNHFLVKYFKNIDFKTITSYIASIISICKRLETINITIPRNLKVFSLNTTNVYKSLTLTPNYNKEAIKYIIELPEDTKVLYVPVKLLLDNDTMEITQINDNTLYYKGQIIDSSEEFILNTYKKNQEKLKTHKITVTRSLELDKNIIYDVGYIEGE